MGVIFDDNFKNFFKTLNSSTGVFTNSQEAINYISDDTKIAFVKAEFDIGKKFKRINGNNFVQVLYSSDLFDYAADNEVTLQSEITSVGKVILKAYRRENSPVWNSEEREDVKFILQNILIAVSNVKMNENIKTILTTDIETGILNPPSFYEYLAMRSAKKSLDGYSTVFLNIKSMKNYNKKFGMSGGNLILTQFSRNLFSYCDETEKFCRLGGDNFTMLIKTDKTDFWKETLSSVPVEIVPQGQQKAVKCFISCYAGFAKINTKNIESHESLILPANMAFQYAKYIKKINFADFTGDIEKTLLHQKEVLENFKPAMAKKELKVFYQPKVDLKTYELCGAEALSRWEYKGEIKSPFWYIPILENTDRICELDIYNLEIVCSDIRKWLDNGLKPVTVSINFSRRHLSNKNLVSDIVGIIEKYNIPKELIEIEITETTDVGEYATLLEFINGLHENNISVSVDDFGTGFSSLNILKDVPIDIIKFDKTLLDETEFKDKMKIVFTNLVNMAKNLNIRTVSEGVETKDQAHLLKNIECDIAQGYYFDKPLSHDEYTEHLKEKIYNKE